MLPPNEASPAVPTIENRKDPLMKTLIALALAATAFAALPAQAQPDDLAVDVVASVPYSDLNLASAAGARTLEYRIKAAANRLCGVEQAPGLAESERVQGCRDSVIDSARPQISQALAMNGTGSVALAASR